MACVGPAPLSLIQAATCKDQQHQRRARAGPTVVDRGHGTSFPAFHAGPASIDLQVLGFDICETRPWRDSNTAVKPAGVLFTDARSTPPRVAAVLCIDKQTHYSDWEPTQDVLGLLKRRNDQQIMGLEILSIAFGTHVGRLSTGLRARFTLPRHVNLRVINSRQEFGDLFRQYRCREHAEEGWRAVLRPHNANPWNLVLLLS